MTATNASPIDSSGFFMLVLSRLVSNGLQLPWGKGAVYRFT
jgi:hypothetical protein